MSRPRVIGYPLTRFESEVSQRVIHKDPTHINRQFLVARHMGLGMNQSMWMVPLNLNHSFVLKTAADNSRHLQNISASIYALSKSVSSIHLLERLTLKISCSPFLNFSNWRASLSFTTDTFIRSKLYLYLTRGSSAAQ